MKYVDIWIGSLMKKTLDLDPREFGIYHLMLYYCYGNERPLPLDDDKLNMICRATKPEDRAAVQAVLKQYWHKRADGWHNERVDEELPKAQQRIEKAAKAAAKRWGHDAQASFEHMPEHGSEHMPEQCSSTCLNDAPQSTIHNPQATDHIPQKSTHTSGKPDTSALRDKGNGQTGDAIEVLEFLNEKTGKSFRPVPANLALITARLAEGASVEDCRAMIAIRVREWANDDRMAKYLRPKTLFDSSNFANYIGEVGTNES